jgi:GT2 family glycosyltransferase
MKVSIIIVNYNQKELLRKCLESIKFIEYNTYDVIVVDNGSRDGSIELLKESYKDHILVEMGYNSGFCKANNVGIHKAFELGSNAVMLLNNDTEVEKDFVKNAMESIDAKNNIGMVAIKVLFMNNNKLVDSAGLAITPDGLNRNLCNLQSSDCAKKSKEVFCPVGTAALYTKELLRDIEDDGQFFDEKFKFYFEDLDVGWRARLRGWRCTYNSKSIVYHHKSATSGAYSKFIAFHTNRNIFYNIIKNYPFGYCVKALFLTFLRYPLLAYGAITGKGAVGKFQDNFNTGDLIVVVLKGWIDVLKNFVKLLKQRRIIQKTKKVTYEEYSKWFEDFGISFFDSLYK